jgi:hypothetical protein
MKNRYEIRGDVTVIFIDSKKYGTLECLIDTEDLERVKAFSNTYHVKYVETKVGGIFYVCGYQRIGTNKYFKPHLHRLLMNPPEEMVVDHLNGNGLDNRKSNLRVVPQQKNLQNKHGAQSNSKSGIKGVYRRNDCDRWCAQVIVNRKKVFNKLFKTKEEAERAVIEARKKFFGEEVS